MRFTMQVPHGRGLTGGLALGAVLLGSTSAAVATTRPVATPTWVTTQGKVVHLTVIAGWNNVNARFNFNGAAHGQMVVTVPLGDKVIGTFKDNVATPHNVVIIPYTTPLPGSSLPPAFLGAASPAPQFRPGAGGPPRTNKPQTFTFVASKAGKYMMICGVPGHALAGMWDTLVVSRTARVASVTFSKAGVTSVTGSTTAPPAKTPTWVTTAGKVVHLLLVSGWNNNNAGFNFNGGAHGQMVVTVPLGDKVVATFKNNVAVFHDVDVIPYTMPLPSHSVTPAFPGSRSPLPSFRPRPGGAPGRGGPPRTNKPQTFTFVASKAGTYMIICGVPGHALAGMWDTFVVSRTARVASVTFM